MKKFIFSVLFVFTVFLLSSHDEISSIEIQTASLSGVLLVDDPTANDDCSMSGYVPNCTVPGGDLPEYPPQVPGGGINSDFKIKSYMYIPD
ncbi:MAG: hypothetical protein KKH92_08845 [Firmicutes bacterium]|nr:hypothetical protein [Bacillota bacterium]